MQYKISGIYQIQSKCKPKRKYIGSAVNIHNRWRIHLRDLMKQKHSSKKLQNHYNKYGEADLQFSILISCDPIKEVLLSHEQFFLDAHRPFFNCQPTAGSSKGRVVTEETRKKISKFQKGRSSPLKGKKQPEEIRERLLKTAFKKGHKPWNTRKNRSEETKRKISDTLRGRHLSEETKRKMSEAMKGKNTWMKGRKLTKEHINNISKSLKGMKKPAFTSEHCKKISESKKRFFLNKKQHETIRIG